MPRAKSCFSNKDAIAPAIFHPPCAEGSIGLAKSASSPHTTRRSMIGTPRRGFAHDRIVDDGQRGRAEAPLHGIRIARLIDGANRRRQAPLQYVVDSGPIMRLERLADVGQLRQAFGHRSRRCSEYRRVTQRLVTARTYDKVSRTLGNARELLCKTGNRAAVDRT